MSWRHGSPNKSLFFSRLSDEIDELKNLAVRDTDEDLFESKEICQRLQAELKVARTERDVLHQDIDQKQLLIQRHDFEMQKQIETVAYLNNEVRIFVIFQTFPSPRWANIIRIDATLALRII